MHQHEPGGHYVRPELYGGLPAPRRRPSRAIIFVPIAAVLLICTGAVIGMVRAVQSAGSGTDTAAGVYVQPSPYGAPAATGGPVEVKPVGDTFGPDGSFEVGADMPAGTYTTVAPTGGLGCYWARVRAFDGELGSIISNGNLAPGARAQLVVKPKDRGVTVAGDCVWTRKLVKR